MEDDKADRDRKRREIESLMEWLQTHPSIHYNGTGAMLIVQCSRCGHTAKCNDGLALSNMAMCVVCEGKMEIKRWNVAHRRRKAPFSYGREDRIPDGIEPCWPIVYDDKAERYELPYAIWGSFRVTGDRANPVLKVSYVGP